MAGTNDIVKLYVGYFNRAPDPAGLQYWLNEAANGMTLAEIAESFSVQSEATGLYPFLAFPDVSSPSSFINSIYLNLFNRPVEEEGLTYWEGQLAGGTPVGQLIVDIMSGATNDNAPDLDTLNNKVEAGLYWAQQVADIPGFSYTDADGMPIPAFEAAAGAAIDGVTDDPETVTDSQAATDELVAGGGSGSTFRLEAGIETVVGTSGNDTFLAETGQLNSGDDINGAGGVDELIVFSEDFAFGVEGFGGGGIAQSPITTGVEHFVLTNQANDLTSFADNAVGGYNDFSFGSFNNGFVDDSGAIFRGEDDTVMVDVEIDAGRMVGVTRWEDYDSRADLVIEDARDNDDEDGTFTRDITVAMVSTDPGNVDYAVYFDDPVNTSARADVITIEVIDQNNSDVHTADDIEPTTPGNLVDAQLLEFTFLFNEEPINIVLDPLVVGEDHFGPDATYADLTNAINLALLENETVAGDVTATLSDVPFQENIGNDNDAEATEDFVFGLQINLTSSSGAELGDAGAGDIVVISRNDPADTAQSITAAPAIEEELITVKIVLDDVGKGSAGGDLLVGAMSTGRQVGDDGKSDSIGIQQFDIHVDRSSNLQTINSTNNSLQEVYIDNQDNATPRGDSDLDAFGDLTVRGSTVKFEGMQFFDTFGGFSDFRDGPFDKFVLEGLVLNGYHPAYSQVSTNQPMPGAVPQHNAYGFTDVRVIDASAMTGSLDATAELTDQIMEKYFDLQDTQDDQDDDNVMFSYDMSNQGDEFLLAMSSSALTDAGTGSREDFVLDVNGNAGDDVLTTFVGTGIKLIDAQGQDWFGMFPSGEDQDNGVPDWYENHNADGGSNPFDISGGAGNDEIWNFGTGDFLTTGGSGNDVIYSDQADVNWIPLITPNLDTFNPVLQRQIGEHNQIDYAVGAVWTFNDDNGFNNFIGDTKGTTNDTIFTADEAASERDYVLIVSYNTPANGGAEDTAYISQVEINLGSEELATDAVINQKIKEAINDDEKLSSVLEAQDGPGQSLIVYSKIGGFQEIDALTVTIRELDGDDNDDSEFSDPELDNIDTDDGALVISASDFVDYTGFNGFPSYGESTIIGGADDDVMVLSSSTSYFEELRFGTDFGHDTVFHFVTSTFSDISGDDATDVLNFTAFNPTDGDGDPIDSTVVTGSFGTSDGDISIIEEDDDIDTAEEVADEYNGTDSDDLFLAIVYDDNATSHDGEGDYPQDSNTGTVYLVEGGENAVATELGKIDLIGVGWETLGAENFGFAADGPTSPGGEDDGPTIIDDGLTIA